MFSFSHGCGISWIFGGSDCMDVNIRQDEITKGSGFKGGSWIGSFLEKKPATIFFFPLMCLASKEYRENHADHLCSHEKIEIS